MFESFLQVSLVVFVYLVGGGMLAVLTGEYIQDSWPRAVRITVRLLIMVFWLPLMPLALLFLMIYLIATEILK